MKRPGIRVLLLVMGVLSAGAYVTGLLTGSKPDDSLLVFAGSMFTTYAITERTDDEDDEPPHRRRRRDRRVRGRTRAERSKIEAPEAEDETNS